MSKPPKIEDTLVALLAAAKMKPTTKEEAAQQEAALLGNGIALVSNFFISLNRIAVALERQAIAGEKTFALLQVSAPVDVHHADEMTEQERLNALLEKKKA